MEQIYVDLIPGGKMPLLHASQYDEGREYRINLTENKQAYTLDGTELLSISVRKGDNTLFTADIANTFGGKSYVDFVSTEQMCAVAGFSFGELSISKNNTRIGTINFTLMVEPSPEEGGVSQSEINNLARQVEELVDDEMGDYLLKTEAEETYAKKTSLSTVATSGDYNDLLNKPSIPAPQVNSDWNADSGVSQILNKPNLATVATSGNYNDLSNKPTIPAAQVNSDWNSNSGVSQILNKPNLSTVATTGNYDDLNNKPTIPVIDDTTKVADKVWSSKKTFDEIVNILPTGNASGAIANFNTSLALPLVSAKFDVNASGGGGTPSTPIPIVGVSSVTVTVADENMQAQETQIINLGGTYYGGYVSQDKNGKRVLVVTHNTINFSEINFNRSNNGGQWNSYLFYAPISGKKRGKNVLCSNYEPIIVDTVVNLANEKMCAPSWNDYIYIRDDNYTTVEAFKAANANTVLLYELADTFTVELPDGEPIIAFNGVNNVYADSGDCEVTYKKSIDDAIAELQALILNA